jgi:hypothetical protein
MASRPLTFHPILHARILRRGYCRPEGARDVCIPFRAAAQDFCSSHGHERDVFGNVAAARGGHADQILDHDHRPCRGRSAARLCANARPRRRLSGAARHGLGQGDLDLVDDLGPAGGSGVLYADYCFSGDADCHRNRDLLCRAAGADTASGAVPQGKTGAATLCG